MKKILLPIYSAIISLIATAAPTRNLADTFATPGEDVATACYWYWLSGNVTRDGVIADLQAMKQAGITRAFIGFQGLDPQESPRGPVYIGTPEWFDIVGTALREASNLGIEIGIFNSPGWSQAGGPWVKPEHSQRYLGLQTVRCEAQHDGTLTTTLNRPDGFLADVKVLAVEDPGYQSLKPISTTGISADGVTEAHVTLKYVIPENFTPRSLTVQAAGPILAQFNVGGKVVLPVNRTNMMIEVGYDRTAPTAMALPDLAAHSGDTLTIEVDINPGCQITRLELSDAPVVDRYADKNLAKMHQTPLPLWHDYKWGATATLQGVDPKDVVDVTEWWDGSTLNWPHAMPGKKYIITRLYTAPTGICNSPALPGDGQGLEVDRWDHDALKHHYENFIGRIRDSVPAHDRRTWNTVVCDSYERATQTFGDDFIPEFQRRYGYDPTPYLLTYGGTVVGNSDLSDRFLWDYRRMVADRLAYDHIGGMRQLAEKDGFGVWLECYGHWGFPGEFLQYGGQSSEVAGEFWSEGDLGNIENRGASSCAHIYGKPLVWSESFTCGGPEYSRSPRDMKLRGDRFFTEGVNATLLHFVCAQPDETSYPGLNAPFGNEFNRKNTWYRHLDLFTDYLKRCNLMLQQGRYVADVAYFIGDDTPVMTGLAEPSLPAGYQYDFINGEVLRDRATVDPITGDILAGTGRYRLLILPPSDTMLPETLEAIARLIRQGANVMGNPPRRSPSMKNYPLADQEVASLATGLWEKGEKGRGHLFTLDTPIEKVLEQVRLTPDASLIENMRYAHVADGKKDIYFIANQSATEPVELIASLRDGRGRQPELWFPASGERRDAQSWNVEDGRVNLPLRLDPMESIFVVFQNEGTPSSSPLDVALNFPEPKQLLDLTDVNWTLTMTPMKGPKKLVKRWKLQDLSLSADTSVAHFSGTMSYTCEFKFHGVPNQPVSLQFGAVNDMARVWVNGQEAGGVWTAPYAIDISPYLRKGKNTLRVDVANNWHNRLVGDAKLPPEQRSTQLFIRTSTPDTPLQPSGLIGPVTLTTP